MLYKNKCVLGIRLQNNIAFEIGHIVYVRMFPIIPQHLLRQNLNNFVLNSLKLSESSRVSYKIENLIDNCDSELLSASDNGVFASAFLVKNSVSSDLLTTELTGSSATIHSEKYKIQKCPTSDHLIADPEQPHNHSWIRDIRFGKDVHSYNVILEITSRRKLRLRVIKDIHVGAELFIWFTQEILAMMYIPFLAPVNILGEFNPLFSHTLRSCAGNYS